jgi:IclR family transcriptional regulator, acetate operon repressor
MATSAQPVQALVRGLRLLEAMADGGGRGSREIGVVELARATALSPATAHRLLATLGGEGYVAHDEATSRYRLGPRLFALAASAESEILTLRECAAPAMEALKESYGETVNLAVLDRRHIVYVDQVESDRPVRAFNRTGNRVLAHASAAGKVLLAFEPEMVVAGLLASGPLVALTSQTITAPDALVAQLGEVARRGYALDLGEQDDDVVCVAAPITPPGRRPAGALSISGPATRMRRLDLDAVGADAAARAGRVLTA